jgi:hypothetical protein
LEYSYARFLVLGLVQFFFFCDWWVCALLFCVLFWWWGGLNVVELRCVGYEECVRGAFEGYVMIN